MLKPSRSVQIRYAFVAFTRPKRWSLQSLKPDKPKILHIVVMDEWKYKCSYCYF